MRGLDGSFTGLCGYRNSEGFKLSFELGVGGGVDLGNVWSLRDGEVGNEDCQWVSGVDAWLVGQAGVAESVDAFLVVVDFDDQLVA